MSKKTNNEKTIFDEIKDVKNKAYKVLEIAKQQELQKIKDGWHYISIDYKTKKLIKN